MNKVISNKLSYLLAAILLFVANDNVAIAETKNATEWSISNVRELWKKDKDRPEYNKYLVEFTQYNNSLHIDTKNNCYNLSKEPVIIYLIITDSQKVVAAIPEESTQKTECQAKNYMGLSVKSPPFSPLVIKMEFN